MKNETNYHKIARKHVNRKVENLCFMSLDDLPDTCQVADIVDNVAEIFESHGYDGKNASNGLKAEYSEAVSEINMEWLEELIFS